MKKDYFAILGLKPDASGKEIRSAYKRLAKKHHPDVNPNNKQAEEKFKEIGEAHEVLTDPEKRRRWEEGEADFESNFRGGAGARGRRRGPGSAGGGAGADPFASYRSSGAGDFSSILNDLFASGMGAAGARRGVRPATRGNDLQFEAEVSFEQAIHGSTLRIPLARNIACGQCEGTGVTRSSTRGGQRVCRSCEGTGSRRATEDIQVKIPAGVENGGKVRVAGKGEGGAGGGPGGDLYVVLRVAPHRYFRREGNDILLDAPMTVSEAALGTRFEVPTIEGRVNLTIPPGAASGQRLRLKGRGVTPPGGGPAGDQIVVLQIVTPKDVDAASRKLLEEFARMNPADPRTALGW